MKRGVLMFEAFVRIAVAILGIFAVAMILYGVYNKFAYSDADQRFDKLVEITRELPEGEFRVHTISLDQNMALIGIPKNSNKIEYKKYTYSIPIVFGRPMECLQGTACLCLCSDIAFVTVDTIQPGYKNFLCKNRLRCDAIPNADFPSDYDIKKLTFQSGRRTPDSPASGTHFGSTSILDKLVGGFIFLRDDGDQDDFPWVSDRMAALRVSRNNNVLTICEERACSGATT